LLGHLLSGRAGCKEEDSIAIATFAEIETTSAFEIRKGLERDLETKSGSEWAAYVSRWVNGGGVVEKLRSSRPGEDGLAERDFDVYDPILSLQRMAATLALSRERVLDITPTQRERDRVPFRLQQSGQGQCIESKYL